MKKIDVLILLSFVITLSSCFRSADLTPALYASASNRHHQLAKGEGAGSEGEWISLIEEFEAIVAINPDGEWADDAQYAIGSCRIWLSKGADLGSLQHAIDALEKLLKNYPDTPLAADAHYWIGNCYLQLGDANRAATHYQKVINDYFDQTVSELAQFNLAQIYEKQNNLAAAIRLYRSVAERSNDSPLVAWADEHLRSLQSGHASSDSNDIKKNKGRGPTRDALAENSRGNLDIHPTLSKQLGLEVKTIVIDPGHGGKDTGAVRGRGYQEKGIVLDLSIMLRDLLVDRGYSVRLTRETDIYLSLQERTQMATMQGADLFISIHANFASRTGASGIETYYLALASDATARHTAARENRGAGYGINELDKLVTQILTESKSEESYHLAECIQTQLITSTKAIDRGVKHAPFVVLIGAKVPAVLVEIGFLSHPVEAEKLMKRAYQLDIAEAIAKGIERYVSSESQTTIKVDGGVKE